LPAGILVTPGNGVWENRQGDRPEAGEAGERLLFFGCGGPLLFLDVLYGAYGGEDVAGLGLFAAGERCRLRLSGLCWCSDRTSGNVGETFRGSRGSVPARRVRCGAVDYGRRRDRRGGRGIVGEGIKQRRLVS
jgi:hypothetical protein